MDIPISRTKIALPAHRAEWLTRPRLLELFYELLEFKLILVTAPAGYGKTTFMADVAHQVDIPTCWFALDELDLDLTRFITHFIASIEARFPGFGTQSLSELHHQNEINLDHLTTILANETYAQIRDHFLIILDDYYLVENNPEVRQFISLFIQRTDENCHIALLTRKLPDLPDLTLLVGRTQVGGLSFRELAFTADEIKTFIHQNYHEDISEGNAKDLHEQTEGWITGLLLSAQSRWTGMANQMRVARASGIDLSAYLMAQVLNQQPDDLCRFLLQTSLLEEYNDQFCEQVLGEAPGEHTWRELIFTVLEKNLFVQPLENGWMRYHHLFKDFLQTQISQKYPDEYHHILYKLANVHTAQGAWEKGRTIYQRLGDQTAIAELIEKASLSLAGGSRYRILANWIDALPYALRFTRPPILSLRGIAAVMLGDVEGGIELLNQAELLFRDSGNTIGLAQALTRRGMANFFGGHYLQAKEDALAALSLLDEKSGLTQAEAFRVLGLSQWRLGDMQNAVQQFEKSRMMYVFLGDENREAIILNELGILYRGLGKYTQAETAYRVALNHWRTSPDISRAAITANNLGVFYHFRGDYRQAAACLEESVAYANRSGDAKALAYSSLGDLYADLNIPDAARAAYTAARPIAQQVQDKFLQLYLYLAEARLAFFHQGKEYASQLLISAEKIVAQGNSLYEKGLYELTRAQLLVTNQPKEAGSALETALSYFDQNQQSNEHMLVHFLMAIVQHKLNQIDLASEHLARALQLADSLGDPQPLIIVAARHQNTLRKLQGHTQIEYQLRRLLEKVADFEKQLPSLRRALRKRDMPIPVDPPKMVIQGLGVTRVVINGKEISGSDWQTLKARDIFFFILENPDGVSREKIEVNFWPEASSSQLKFTFKKTMYRLRRAFESDPLLYNGDRYMFDYKGDYEYDVEELERVLKQSERALDEKEKISLMKMAFSIYLGPYLPEVDELWAMEKREYLARKYLETTRGLGEDAYENGDYLAAISYCQTLLAVDPCDEAAHRLAMRSHAARGSRSDVVKQYKLCKKALEKEYGVAPSRETVELHKTLIH
jgi:LuxR family transcriptional regulator, maltose regulon positive regulatory protein